MFKVSAVTFIVVAALAVIDIANSATAVIVPVNSIFFKFFMKRISPFFTYSTFCDILYFLASNSI